MSRYAEASLKITLQTQDYKNKLREQGSFTDKELERETAKYRAELKKREQAEAKSESAILAEKQRAVRASEKLRTDAARRELAMLAQRQEAEAAASAVTGRASKQIDAMAKSMRLAIPQAGALGEKFGGVARVIDDGFNPALVAAGGAIAVVVAGVVKLGTMALDTAANIDEIKKSLGSVAAGTELHSAVHEAEQFADATAKLNEHWTEFSTILSGRVLRVLAPIQDKIDKAVQSMMWLMDREGYAAREAQKAIGGEDPNDPSTWSDPGFTAIATANAANVKPVDSGTKSASPSRSSSRSRSSSAPAALPDLVGQGVRDIFAELEQQYQELADASAKAAVDAANAVQTMNDAAMDADRARIAEEEEAHKDAVARWIELEQMKAAASESVIGSVAGAVSAIGDLWSQSTDDAAEAARRQAVIARTLAVFQLAQDLAKAIGAAIPWAAATGPGAIAAVPAIIGSMTAVFADIAAMLAPVPKFHTGGRMMPDEGPAILKRGEVVIDAPRAQAAGGADGVRRALDGGGGGNITVLVDLGDRVIETIARKIERRYRGPIRAWGSA